jgi:isopropylmalate/homocitrate/citramalate synthase
VGRSRIVNKVQILDTTLREGELNTSVYYTQKKLEIIGTALAQLGTPRIEFSVTYPQRGGNLNGVRDILSDIQSSYDSTLIIQCRALREDIDLAQKMEPNGCGIYLAISNEHRENKLGGMTIEEATLRLMDSLDYLKESGFKYRRAVLEDASRFFSQYRSELDKLSVLKRAIEAADEADATTISLPDTAGLVEEDDALTMFEFASSITDKELAAHFHNDYGNALGNTKAVVKSGRAAEPHVSIYGLGAGAGIADHYELSANLMDNLGMDTGEDRGYFQTLYKIFQKVTKIPIPWNHPLSDFARTEKAGTHQAQQLNNPEGYVPGKKLNHDFENTILFDVGRLMSRRLVRSMLEGFDIEENKINEIVTLISRRSSLYNRKLYNKEIKVLIKEVADISLPTALISQYVGSEKAFFLLRVTPQSTSEITEKIEELEGVDRVLETYGSYDIVVEASTENDMQRLIERAVGEGLMEISPLIVG